MAGQDRVPGEVRERGGIGSLRGKKSFSRAQKVVFLRSPEQGKLEREVVVEVGYLSKNGVL